MLRLFHLVPQSRIKEKYRPYFKSEKMLQRLLVATMVGALFYILLLMVKPFGTNLIYAQIAFIVSGFLLVAARNLGFWFSAVGWTTMLWLLTAVMIWRNEGIYSVGYSGYALLIIGACLLLGRRIGLCVMVASMLYGVVLIYVANQGWNPHIAGGPQAITRWILHSIHFAIIFWFCDFIVFTIQYLFQTMQQQIKEHKAESELLNSVMNTSVAAITILDPQGTIVYANKQAEHVIGLSLDDILKRQHDPDAWKRTDLDGVPLPETLRPLNIIKQTKQPISDVRLSIETFNDERKYLSVNGAPILDEDGEIKLLVFSVSDITQNYTTELALRNSERRYRMVSEVMTNFAYAYAVYEDGSTDCRWMTDTVERITGYSQDMVQSFDIWRNYVHEHDQELFDQVYDLVKQGIPQNAELRFYVQSGSAIWLRHYIHPELDPATGKVLKIYGAAQDVTQLKQLQQQLLHSQKMEAIGRLAGGIAHDFNNILTVILGHCSFALEDLPEDSLVLDDVNQVRLAAERATMLTRQLLAFSRQQVLQAQVLNLNSVLQSLHSMLKRLIGEDIELSISYDPQIGFVSIDDGQLQQVILNLVVNARDAMPSGGSISLQTKNVMFSPEPGIEPQPFVQLKICDTGLGMDEQTRARIFEPFFTTKDVNNGTGLGLSIVHGIVTQHQGYILADSYPHVGTVFTILFPQVEPSELEHAPLVVPALPAQTLRQILLVEDEEMVRILIERVLQRKEYNIVASEDGQDALMLLNQFPQGLDLLITDVVLPNGMNGVQLAEMYRREYPQLKVLFLSGYTDPAIVDQSMFKAGPWVSFIQKPFDTAMLLQKVSDMLEPDSASS